MNESRQPISQEAWDWAIAKAKEIDIYKLANPDWADHLKRYEQFKDEALSASGKKR